MDKTKFQAIVKEYIEEYSSNSSKDTISKRELKEVIKMTIKTILNEMDSSKKMTGPWTVSLNDKIYHAQKDEDTGIFYYQNMDTGTLVPLGTEEGGVQVQKLEEMTDTNGAPPINLPGSAMPGSGGKSGWVAKKGGSQRGLEGSPSGMELTTLGAKDMRRKQDNVH